MPTSIPANAKKICVLATWPILTITIEGADDRGDQIYLHAGGQGFWVARMIRNLGDEPVMCGPFGGETGIVIEALARAEGVDLKGIATEKWNGAYVHDRREGARSSIAETVSPTLNRHEHDDLYDMVLTTALEAGTMALTGSKDGSTVPAEFYGRLARDLDSNGVKVVADLSGDALCALNGGVNILKVSDEEARESGYCSTVERHDIISGLRELRSTGARTIVVSRADEPALAMAGDELFEVRAPRLEPLDHRGAGDSMTAALCHAQAHEFDIESALKLAAAAGALNVTRHGLGTGRLADVESLARSVEVARVSV